MAAIVQFQTYLKKERKAESLQAGDAQIIIFSGVRFERLDDTSGAAPPPLEHGTHHNAGLRRRSRRTAR